MKNDIKEMEHIEAQEHINSCPECLKEYKKEMKDTYEKGKEDGRQEEREKLSERIEIAFKKWFSKEWRVTKYKANYPDNPLEDFKKTLKKP